MEFLNKGAAQIADLFRSMTAGARIIAALLAAVILVSLGYLFNGRISGPSDYLLGAEPIPASQIPMMEQAFAEAGLNDYVVEGNRIRVPQAKRNQYVAALGAGNALPPNFYDILDTAVTSTGPFTDKLTKEQLIKNARQTQLAMIIREMKGIDKAMVLFDTITRSGLRRETIMTASVSVKPLGNQPLEESQVPALRNLVASSIAGLDAKNVTVTDLNTNRNYTFAGDGPLGDAEQDRYASRKRMYEHDWRAKIAEGLTMVPGAIVTVNVELDPQTLRQEREVTLDPKAVPVHRVETSILQTTEGAAPGGRPGLAGQRGGGPAAAPLVAGAHGPRSNTEESEARENNVVGGKNALTDFAGLTPQRVKVALGIPMSYIRDVWRSHNPTPPGEEPKTPDTNALAAVQTEVVEKLEKHVANLIPQARAAQDTRPDITVTVFPDIESSLEIPEVATSTAALDWLGGNWQTIGMAALGLFGLLMLRSFVRSAPSPGAEHAAAPLMASSNKSASAANADENILPIGSHPNYSGDDEANSAEKRLRRRLENGPSLRDELTDMVREDPTAAANILKTWIGAAS